VADTLNIGTSALLSLQRAISTTGHNIANVNTEGFSRQRVEFATLPAQRFGDTFIGTGVTTASITRDFNQFLTDDVRSRTASSSGLDTFRDLSARMDGLLADPAVGLGPALEDFFGAVQNVANNPASLPERRVMIGEAEVLADRFQNLDERFRDINSEVNLRIESAVRDLNTLAQSVASLNERIVTATAQAGGQPPNDLLDARDQAINRIAERVGVTTVRQDDGAINVLVGNGQPLVVGFNAEALTTGRDPFDVTRTTVGIAGLAGRNDIGRFLSGGELGAALDFRENVLDGARRELGLLASGVAFTFNEQHRKGIDLNGQAGGDFFRPLQAVVVGSAQNTGSAAVSAAIDDPGGLTGDEYRLSFDGAQWTLRNTVTGASQTGTGPVFNVDGVELTISGTPAPGDTFQIQPVAQGASLFDVTLTDPREIAAGNPLRSAASAGNNGSGVLDDVVIDDPATLPLGAPVSLTFNPDALGAGVPGYDVTGIAGGPIAFDPAVDSNGISASLGGFSFTLGGTPQAGDSFTLDNNSDGVGDNRNALALASLQTATTLNGGTASYQDAYSGLVSGVAVETRRATSAAETESVLLNQALEARNSVQGVNLDEEAANLLRYQQAYQAAAQVISVADTLFQTLLAATRR
jgi:flagellar hook-associated protein 1 FlgK